MHTLNYSQLLASREQSGGTSTTLHAALQDVLELLASYQTQQLMSPSVRSTLEASLPDVHALMNVLEQFGMNSHEEVTRLLHTATNTDGSVVETSYVETSSDTHAASVKGAVHRDASYVGVKVKNGSTLYKRTLSNDLDVLLA